ncbi:AAA family ATPase [Evansella sp. AB-rgal1]|uniref:AAA family ATPase n=1 Tax=Evansella sp. AB-rgal1 TaxID=3242696 RepID=UPI00359CD998
MRQQTTFGELYDRVQAWTELPFHKLREQEIVRELTKLEQQKELGKEEHIMKGQLLMMAAVARFNRYQEGDGKVEERLEEALSLCKDDPYVKKGIVYLSSYYLSEVIFSAVFPKIRETDHSQGKKKTIQQIQSMLQEGLQITKTLIKHISRYEHGAQEDRDTLRKAKDGKSLLLSIISKIEETMEHAARYEATISGIYSSKEKLEILHQSIEEIRVLSMRWEEWQENLRKEEEASGLKKLHSLVGLNEVKEKVHNYYYYLVYEKEREKHGFQLQNEQSLNMILTGNPGTGKTEIARLLAKIYYDLGVLPKESILEVDRSHLVGSYVGQTEEKTMNVIKEAVGGVLFIDEAYSLKRENSSGTDYGQTAIDTIVSAMTSGEYAGKFSVILAGYPEEMRSFLWSNPGLRSRFPESNHIHLPDYTLDELIEIGEQVALDNDFSITEEGLQALRNRIEEERVDESFGNARTVINIISDAIFRKGSVIGKTKQYSRENFVILDDHDFSHKKKSEQTHNSAEERLNELIGLSNVKEQVNILASFVKVQQKRAKSGLPAVPIQLHAIFTGPPGTGKTTVASLYSKILNELGLLKRGHLVIAGRSDLVAGYVGQTAIKTKKKIKEALGGVLFIDEAYSLLSRGNEDFGKEAIDTLVEEMTKHEENLVVILAGYPSSMEPLMNSNPGLISRFKKVIEFPSYEPTELIEILEFYIKKHGYFVDENTKSSLLEITRENPPKGNGRSMKDMVEDAIQRQAYRIMNEKMDYGEALIKLEDKDFLILHKRGD